MPSSTTHDSNAPASNYAMHLTTARFVFTFDVTATFKSLRRALSAVIGDLVLVRFSGVEMFAGWSEICPTLRLPDEVANPLNRPNESLGYRARTLAGSVSRQVLAYRRVPGAKQPSHGRSASLGVASSACFSGIFGLTGPDIPANARPLEQRASGIEELSAEFFSFQIKCRG